MGRLLGALALILVLYAIVSQPLTSAAVVRSVGATLASVATSTTQFITAVTVGGSSAAASTSVSRTSGATYTVRPGDTLSGIAAAHGTTAGALAAENGLSNPNRIVAGQQLAMR
jgi:LysM repeat protein